MIHRLPLLTRLRRHRGLWTLALAVLLIKLAAGTACLTDSPGTSLLAEAVTASVLVQNVDAQAADPKEAGCVLGESGGCHCACAHNLPLPSLHAQPLPAVDTTFVAPRLASDAEPAFAGSLLRPPIA